MHYDRNQFEAIAIALFGWSWHQSLADALQVGVRRVQRWGTSDTYPIPPGIWDELAELLDKRATEQVALAVRLRQAIIDQPPEQPQEEDGNAR